MITLLFQTIAGNATASLGAVLPYFPYAIGAAILVGVGLVIKKRMDMKKQIDNGQPTLHDPLNFGYGMPSIIDNSPGFLNRIYLMATGKKNSMPQPTQYPQTPTQIAQVINPLPGLNIPPGYDILIVKKVTADRAKALAIINQKTLDETIFKLVEDYLNNRSAGKKGSGNAPPAPPQKTAINSIGDYLGGKASEFSKNEGFWKQG